MSFSLVIKTTIFRNPLCKCATLQNKFGSVSISSSADEEREENEKQKKGHMYSQRWKYVNEESTSKYLLEKIIYHQEGVVAINKPSGLGSSKNECSIYHSLPFLAKELGYKYLKLVKVPEKSVSGVTVLAADTATAERVKKSIRRSKGLFSENPTQTFLALTVGHPIRDDGSDKFGVKSQYNDKQKHSLIVRKWSENERKRRDVSIGVINHKVVAQSDLASLVTVSTWQEHEHCPRLFLSDILLSPALGDQKFGGRVSSLFGKPILLKPWLAPAVKALPPPLLKSLGVLMGSEGLIPMHFHLHVSKCSFLHSKVTIPWHSMCISKFCYYFQELTLHRFGKDKSDLFLRAEPPEFFQWSCKQLSLELPVRDAIGQPLEIVDEDKNPSNTQIFCN